MAKLLQHAAALFEQALLEMLEMLLVHAFYLLRAAGGWHCYTSLVRAIGTRDPSKSDWCSAACWSAAGTLRAPPGTRSSLENPIIVRTDRGRRLLGAVTGDRTRSFTRQNLNPGAIDGAATCWGTTHTIPDRG